MNIIAARRRPSTVWRTAPDRAELGLLIFVALVGMGSSCGPMIARHNFHVVVPQLVYRSGQPTPEQLHDWIDRYGLKTIVNLRGPTAPGAAEERALAESMGVGEVCLELHAYELMSGRTLVQLLDVLQTAKPPMLLHCYYGVDRAGTAAALAEWLLGHQPYDRARWQAYVPPGPWKRHGHSGHVSDVLALYEDFCRVRGLNPDDPSLFQHWAREIYSAQSHATASGPRRGEDAGRLRDESPT